MADKETDLKLTVGAVADKESAGKAAKDITKAVESSVKGGRIEVPVDITIPIDKSKDKLTKAQKDITATISKMMSKGFSASGKDIDTLVSKFNEFTKAFDQAGKGRQNKIFREIRKQVDDLQKSYRSLQQVTKSTRTHNTKVDRSTTKKPRKPRNFGLPSDEEITANIKSEQKRRLSGLKQIAPRGFKRNTGFDTGVATERTLKATERGGSYPSNYARQMKISELAAVKWMRKSLKIYQSENIANDYSSALQNGKNKNNLTNEQKASEKANLTSNELAKILGGIEANRPDASIDRFNKYLEATLQLDKVGKGGYDAIMLALNKTFNRYFNTTGTLGITDGKEKGVGEGHTQARKAIIGMIKSFKDKLENGFADKLVKVGDRLVNVTAEEVRQLKVLARIDPRAAEKEIDRILRGVNVSSTKQGSTSKLEQEVDKLTTETKNTTNAVKTGTKETRIQTTYDKLDNVKKDVDEAKHIKVDEVNRDINKDVAKSVKADETTGFNTNEKADAVIDLLRQILSAISGGKSDLLALPPAQGMKKVQETAREAFKNALKSGASYEEAQQKAANVSNKNKAKNTEPNGPVTNGPVPPKGLTGYVPPYRNKVEKSNIYASPVKTTVWDKLEDAFNRLTGATREYNKVINANADEQDRMAAERIKTWGMNNGRNPNDTGDIAGMRRILQLYRTNKSSIEQNPELKQKIRLTPGREVDTTAVTKALAKALSGKQMRNAQMGGSIPRQILGAFTGFVGMPSIEKSRAQADGLNQTLGNINKALQSVLSSIQMKETELAGMEKIGEVQFNDEGYVTKGSSAAYKTLADLEEYKVVLDSILADMNMVDRVVGQTDGKFSKLVKRLSFTSPVLRENNSILRNINAGLDKNGKALKFQTRMAEILNYTFQLISRSIGQWFKRLISMLNPFNILKNLIRTIVGWVKSAFQDFGSYDVKWQRTMNVIKINFQRAIKPMMEWIAQKLVNIIGFFNIISMKIQEAFGQIPVDLFDQAGANAEKMRRELEEARNVTASFDELHDIGTDNSAANDLLGDIYKPQLSKEWEDLANRIGDLFAGLIKGDLGFGEVALEILKILGELLGKIAKKIWDWFKETAIGKWITDHWKELLATLLALFIGWKLLKIFGPTILKALGNLVGSILKGAGTLLGKIGKLILTWLGGTAFGKGIIEGLTSIFTGSGGLLTTLHSIFAGHEAITAFGAWGETLGALFAQTLVAAIGVGIGVFSLAKGNDKMRKNTAYNLGLDSMGGREEDKKSNVGAGVLSTLGSTAGFALAGTAIAPGIGTVIGAGVGLVAGILNTILAPVLESIETKARDMNNELQKIEYYEGQVQGATTQTELFDEQLKLLKESLQLSTDKVYEQGEKLGISKTRMDELVASTQDGTFNTDLLTGSEIELASSLTDLAQKQEHVTEVSKKLEDAQKKLLKAQTDLSIAQDVEAGNFELAAARIEVAEAQGTYSTEEATKKRIQLYKEAGKEERANLLQNLTGDQRQKMAEYNAVTEDELADLIKAWRESGQDVRDALLSGVDSSTQQQFAEEMNKIDGIIKEHQGFWQGVGDTLKEIFTFGNSTTWTYNGEQKYADEVKKGKYTSHVYSTYAVGTNYVPNDQLAYLHKGEAVIPAKYNQGAAYKAEGNIRLEESINQLNKQVAQIGEVVNQGIRVQGQFIQRGTDLVASVEKTNNKISNAILNNKVYAR